MSNLPDRDQPAASTNASFETSLASAKREGIEGVLEFLGELLLAPLLGFRAPVVQETLKCLDGRNLSLLGIDRRDLEDAWDPAAARPVRVAAFEAARARGS